MKRLFIVMFLLLGMSAATAYDPSDTNPPDIQEWFRTLANRMGGGCCGDADSYPAIVLKMPNATDEQGRENYHEDGEAVIIDPSAKEIITHGIRLKMRPALKGDLHVKFSWMKMTKEKYGNPFNHAFVFVNSDGNGLIRAVYCVVIVPQDV